MKHLVSIVLVALVLTAPATHSLHAQATGPVSVAIPDRFPEIDASAVVIREGPRDVILLKGEEASPETLFIALGVLRRARAERPVPSVGEMIPVLGYALSAVLKRDDRDRLETLLHRVGGAEPRDLGPWGLGRLVRMSGS
jgi:hypothetical protein